MELKGIVVSVLPEQTGTSRAGKEWRKREFVIETEGQYPKKVCIELFGDKTSKCPQVGAQVTVAIDIESREYQGRWFTQVSAWDVKSASATTAQVAPATAPAPTAPSSSEGFPF